MARNDYNDQTASAFKLSREHPQDRLEEWRRAVQRHVDPQPGQTLIDIGAGVGTFTNAFVDWFNLNVVAVEPSDAMRAHIQKRAGVHVIAGQADTLPLSDESADVAWMSNVIHHVPDLPSAALEIQRVLRPGGRFLLRQVFPGQSGLLELIRWFPEASRMIDSYPTIGQVCEVFASAGFHRVALESISHIELTSLVELLDNVDLLRQADTALGSITDEEFLRGKQRLQEAARQEMGAEGAVLRKSWFDLLVWAK